jgi:2-C-methyl-D-erythritol 4-phosphate cytidylyltransferase
MGSRVAKQFLPLSGKPIILHSFEAFYRFDPDIQFILVLFPSLLEEWQALIDKYDFRLPHAIVEGGAERFHSVKHGLAALHPDVRHVAVHDAVRPLASSDTISRSFAAAETHGAAVPVVPVTDTIRQTHQGQSHTLPRSELCAVQTPQCFSRAVIDTAYQVDFNPDFTDDASVVERSGHYIHLCEGNRSNIKVTTPEDLLIAEALFAASKNF